VHLSRPVVLAGTAFAGMALLLPFVRLPVLGAIDGIGADAWPALLPAVPAVAAAVFGDWSRGNGPLVGTTALVLACAGLLFAVVKLADALIAIRGVDGASFGAGSPVLVAAMATVVAGAGLSLRRSTG